jgi:hypothetical protein
MPEKYPDIPEETQMNKIRAKSGRSQIKVAEVGAFPLVGNVSVKASFLVCFADSHALALLENASIHSLLSWFPVVSSSCPCLFRVKT